MKEGKEEEEVAEEEEGTGYVTTTNTPKTSSDVPIIDNGATDHLWNDKSSLINLIPCTKTFRTGNQDSPIKATAVGEIYLKPRKDGFSPIVIPQVFYSPQIGVKLMSEKKILSQFPGSQRGGGMEDYNINQKGHKILTARGPGNALFTLESHVVNQPNKTSLSSYALFNHRNAKFLHHVCGHINPRKIAMMAKNGSMKGLPTSLNVNEFEVCPDCVAGKKTKERRNPTTCNFYQDRTIETADSWHSDQKGPIHPQSNHRNIYFVLFIDEATKYMFVEFLHTLTQTQDAYNKLRTTVSTHFKGKKIRFFRADGHGTYTSDEMMATYEEDGTIPKFRAPHDPNGNALSERGIRTIISMARTLLHSSGLPLNMWEAAVRHAVWIHNRVTTRDEDVKSPHQLFWGTIPDVRHLHPFGCLAYALIQKETNPKLRTSSQTMHFSWRISET